MKRFIYERRVEAAEGTQSFYIDAETQEEADARASKMDTDGLYEEEVEVIALGEILELVDETSTDDYGRFPPHQPSDSQAEVSDTALIDWMESDSPTIKPELVAMGDTGDYYGEIVVYNSCMNPRDRKRLGAGETYREAIKAAMQQERS